MKQWHIYKKDTDVEAVKDGFNWWAFFFPGIWALVRGLTLRGSFAFAAQITSGMSTEGAIILGPIVIIISFLYGFKGNSWVCAKLEKKGYRLIETLQAASKTGALSEFTINET